MGRERDAAGGDRVSAPTLRLNSGPAVPPLLALDPELSTTTVPINGDLKQPVWRRLRYRAAHRRLQGDGAGATVEELRYWPGPDGVGGAGLDVAPIVGSPSRLLCDLFWANLPWQGLRALLGRLALFDLGCGDGRYAALFQRFAGAPLSYVGADVRAAPAWAEAAGPDVRFTVYDGEDFEAAFPEEATLFVSQSCLEHVPHDRAFVRAAARFAARVGRPVAHVHLAPGPTGLRQWDLHGWRQYGPAQLRQLQRDVAEGGGRAGCVALGDARYVALHRARFRPKGGLSAALPRLDVDTYRARLAALLKTPRAASLDSAAFVALVALFNSDAPIDALLPATAVADLFDEGP